MIAYGNDVVIDQHVVRHAPRVHKRPVAAVQVHHERRVPVPDEQQVVAADKPARDRNIVVLGPTNQ